MSGDKRHPWMAGEEGDDRPRRVVVDEIVGGKYRVLISKMKTTATEDQLLDPLAWEEEEEHAMDERQLEKALTGQDVRKVREGHVFKVKAGKSESIYKEAREHVKEKARVNGHMLDALANCLGIHEPHA